MKQKKKCLEMQIYEAALSLSIQTCHGTIISDENFIYSENLPFENLIICHIPSFILSTPHTPQSASVVFSSQGATAGFLLTFSILSQNGTQRCLTETKLKLEGAQ